MLNEEEISRVLQNAGIEFAPNSSLYGVVVPSATTYMLAGPIANFAMSGFVIHFGRESLDILPLDGYNNIQPQGIHRLPLTGVSMLGIKKGMLMHTLIIVFQGNRLTFKVNKSVPGKPWHKNSLDHLMPYLEMK